MEPEEKERFIDDWLDAALKPRGAAEPRSGLENRILARLRDESAQKPASAWTWRLLWVGLAAMLVIGAWFVAQRPEPSRQVAAVPAKLNTAPTPQSEKRGAGTLPSLQHTRSLNPRHKLGEANPAVPKLEEFPSPQPLSEQEEILALYVEQFPHDAVLLAQAQMDFAQPEIIVWPVPEPDIGAPTHSDEQNQ